MIALIVLLCVFILVGIFAIIGAIGAGNIGSIIWDILLLVVAAFLLRKCWAKRKAGRTQNVRPPMQTSHSQKPTDNLFSAANCQAITNDVDSDFESVGVPLGEMAKMEAEVLPARSFNPYNITPKTKVAIREFRKTNEYVVLDVETTGLSPNDCVIIELAMIHKAKGEVVDTYSKLFDPGVPLPDKIVKLTGITDEMLSGSPAISTALEEIDDFIGDLPIVAHNAPFDVRFLEAAMGGSQQYEYIDTLSLARKAYPEMVNHKLGTLTAELGITNIQSHRALPDVEATDTLFNMCLDKILSTVKKRS